MFSSNFYFFLPCALTEGHGKKDQTISFSAGTILNIDVVFFVFCLGVSLL